MFLPFPTRRLCVLVLPVREGRDEVGEGAAESRIEGASSLLRWSKLRGGGELIANTNN